MVWVEPPGGVGKDQPHIRVRFSVSANCLLVCRVGEGSRPYDVQRDDEPLLVGDSDLLLREELLDSGPLCRGPGGKQMIGFEADKASCADGLTNVLGVMGGADQHLCPRAGPLAHLLRHELVDFGEVYRQPGKGKEQSVHGTSRHDLIDPAIVLLHANRCGSAWEKRQIGVFVKMSEGIEMSVGVEDLSGHEAVEFTLYDFAVVVGDQPVLHQRHVNIDLPFYHDGYLVYFRAGWRRGSSPRRMETSKPCVAPLKNADMSGRSTFREQRHPEEKKIGEKAPETTHKIQVNHILRSPSKDTAHPWSSWN